MLLRSTHATACCTVQPSCFQCCIKVSSCTKNTYRFKILSIIITYHNNVWPSINEGIYYVMCVAQGDVHLGYRCCDATGIVHHSLLQTVDGTRVPRLTSEVLEPPFAAGKENNSGEAPLPDGCSYTFHRHLGFTSSQCSPSYGAGKFLTNRSEP